MAVTLFHTGLLHITVYCTHCCNTSAAAFFSSEYDFMLFMLNVYWWRLYLVPLVVTVIFIILDCVTVLQCTNQFKVHVILVLSCKKLALWWKEHALLSFVCQVIHVTGRIRCRPALVPGSARSVRRPMGLVALAHTLPPSTLNEVRMESQMFVFRVNMDLQVTYCENR